MKILFLSRWYPYPPNNGSKLRIFNLLRGLAREHRVTLLTLADEVVDRAPPELEAICERVLSFRRPAFDPRSVRGLLSPVPRSLVATHDPRFAAALRRELARGTYDLLIASQWAMAPYAVTTPEIPCLFEEVELGLFTTAVDRARWPASRLRRWLTLWKLGLYLRRILPRFSACTVVSDVEAELVHRLAPGHRAVVVPNGVDVGSYQDARPTPRPDSLIYSGGLSYSANYEAVLWFIRETLPLIRARRPGVALQITGDPGGRRLPTHDGVELTGFVDDVRPLIATAWVSIAPLLTGGGTRLKILEAMALRTPVVATRKGAEGLELTPGRHALIADTPHELAEAVVRLLESRALRDEIADRAYQLVATHYDWSAVLPTFLQMVEQAVKDRRSAVIR